MSRNVLTVGPLLYRGEYSQWVERFMNYLEEQTDREAMINSIKNDKSMWSDQEKRIQKIDHLARSLLIQGLPNDIYSLINSNKTAKDLWDALARHMLGSEYGYVNDAMGSKKKIVMITSDPLAFIAEKTNVSRRETSSAFVCNDPMNVSCNSRINDLLDDKNFFIFDDVNVRISPVNKMPFRKKPRDSMHIVQIYLWIIDSGCSKHMTGNRALLMNFVEKFLRTVCFGNNDFAMIAGYGDVVIDEASDVIISFIKKTQVNLQLQVHRVRTDNGTEFKNKTLAKFFDEVGITQQFSAARTPQQNGVVERRNRTLVEAARTMLTFANLPSFLWAEAITTACFTQNHSIIHKHFDKTPYELINKRKPNIKFFRVFGCRCYLLNDYDDVGKLKANVNFDEISKMASKQFSLEPSLSKLNETGKSSNRSVSKVDEATKKDFEDLFQDFYDEYFDEISELFQGESSLSSLNDDVQQSPEESFVKSIHMIWILVTDKTWRLTNIHFLLKNSIQKRCLNIHLKDCEILMSNICQEQAYSFASSNICLREELISKLSILQIDQVLLALH
uniref:Retrotransposon protein, putative, unclassified n=1 Tax=Tanacetum cinerariifolium TaxID=118510 RepID=A0A6L2K2S6_TANCI|nr:retrotransposon protein, putative, unclassified [Tanacetum cinerariifolium]